MVVIKLEAVICRQCAHELLEQQGRDAFLGRTIAGKTAGNSLLAKLPAILPGLHSTISFREEASPFQNTPPTFSRNAMEIRGGKENAASFRCRASNSSS